MGFLTDAVERTRRELQTRPRRDGTLVLQTRALPPPRDLEAALRAPGIGVIAEVKRSSPSAGPIADADPGEQAERYERGGAVAVSVLTEPRYFGGTLADIRLARRRCALPILRKDFIVDPSQVLEARAEGADAVLLIAAALDRSELEDLQAAARELGLAALVEAHTPEDLAKALGVGAAIVGVNARDLETLEVDIDRALALLADIPAGPVRVLESGVSTRRDVRRAEEAGAEAVLIGEALMRAADPERELRRLLWR